MINPKARTPAQPATNCFVFTNPSVASTSPELTTMALTAPSFLRRIQAWNLLSILFILSLGLSQGFQRPYRFFWAGRDGVVCIFVRRASHSLKPACRGCYRAGHNRAIIGELHAGEPHEALHDEALLLELGADDYVTKPFSLRELPARVHSVRRRIHGQNEVDQYSFGTIAVIFKNGGHTGWRRSSVYSAGIQRAPWTIISSSCARNSKWTRRIPVIQDGSWRRV